MIYLLKGYGPKGLELLKIGYAEDVEKRLKQHLTSNPCIELLNTREGDYELESLFHGYYKKYSYQNRKEWFLYNQEIVDNFLTMSKETLRTCKRVSFLSSDELNRFIKSKFPKTTIDINVLKSSEIGNIKNLLNSRLRFPSFKKIYDRTGGEKAYLSHFRRTINDLYRKLQNILNSYDYYNIFSGYSNVVYDLINNEFLGSINGTEKSINVYSRYSKIINDIVADVSSGLDKKFQSSKYLLSSYSQIKNKDYIEPLVETITYDNDYFRVFLFNLDGKLVFNGLSYIVEKFAYDLILNKIKGTL